MHWGLRVECNQSYKKVIDRAFTITNAILDYKEQANSKSCDAITKVYVEVCNESFLLCLFHPRNGVYQTSLYQHFSAGETVTFSHNGQGNVYLMGNIEENIKSLSSSTECPLTAASPQKSTAKSKQQKKEEKNVFKIFPNTLKDLLNGEELPDEDSEDQDEDFEATMKDEEEEDDDEEEEDEEESGEEEEEIGEEEESLNENAEKNKNKLENGIEDEEESEEDSEEESGEESDDEMSEEDVETQSPPIVQETSQKKKKNKLANGSVNKQESPKKEKHNKQESPKKEKTPNAPKTIEDAPPNELKKANKLIGPKEVKAGGVICQDIIPGKGQKAFSGKQVSVYYEGRLKSNNKMFDKVNSGAPFKFKLGGGEVITGWDVGVAGMRIGGKRRIVCPPKMGYGKKGAPPQIPPNAILVFDVTLKAVK